MSLEENLELSIKTIDDLLRCVNLASLLELSGWHKPGNIHRTKDFNGTRFEHFLAGISAIQPNFRDLCERTYKTYKSETNNSSFIKLGEFFEEASMNMMRWQKGGNVLLGHILILAPLVAAASICLSTKNINFSDFKSNCIKVIDDASVDDTIRLYNAIRISNPGGLGRIDNYDIYDDDSTKRIQKDEINLKKIFELSKDYDLISLEYSTGFNIILNEGFNYYREIYYKYNDINIATVNTYFKILSIYPDTLIIRKSGVEAAQMISNKANEILKIGGISTEKGIKLSHDLDDFLQEKNGKLNPGTTADIIAGIIFCSLIFGLKF